MVIEIQSGENAFAKIRHLLKANGYSLTQIRKLKKTAVFSLDGLEVGFVSTVARGQILTIAVQRENTVEPQSLSVPLVFEDEYILAVDKDAGMLVHPSTQERTGTLANFIAWYSIGKREFDGIHFVSRLDRGTSGLVLVAKTARMQNLLAKTEIEKTYLALLQSSPPAKYGVINLNIARKAESIIERTISVNGKMALTYYTVLEKYDNGTALVEFELRTGRTHQLRVHAAALGCPVFGDSLYGEYDDNGDKPGHCLHAVRLSFLHPIKGSMICLESKNSSFS